MIKVGVPVGYRLLPMHALLTGALQCPSTSPMTEKWKVLLDFAIA